MRRVALPAALAVAIAAVACGKKGPPLPPLVRLPSAPADFAAELRGVTVDLQFTVPTANTDNSRPANVQRVDVYGITTGETLTDAQFFKIGKRVASIDVKAPRDPDSAIEEDEPPADMEAPEGKGLDQGARAHVTETLNSGDLRPATIPADRKASACGSGAGEGPLLPPRRRRRRGCTSPLASRRAIRTVQRRGASPCRSLRRRRRPDARDRPTTKRRSR